MATESKKILGNQTFIHPITGESFNAVKSITAPSGATLGEEIVDDAYIINNEDLVGGSGFSIATNSGNILIVRMGAKGDAKVVYDGSMDAGAAVLTSATADFTVEDEGKVIFINGADTDNKTLCSTITEFISSTEVMLEHVAENAVTGQPVTFGTDNTDAFWHFNRTARALTDRNIVFELAGGTYLTKYNNWLAGIKNVEVRGNGSKIICTYGGFFPDNPFPCVPLFMPYIFQTIDNNYYVQQADIDGDEIYTTSPVVDGATNYQNWVQLKTPALISNYKTGDYLFIYGWDNELIEGSPVSPRFFEYQKIVGIDAENSRIILERDLIYQYCEDWPQLEVGTIEHPHTNHVNARILNCNRSNFTMIENLRIQDLEFVKFENWVSTILGDNDQRNGRIEIYGAINAVLFNVRAPNAYFGTSKNITLDGCEIYHYCEPDKCGEVLNILNSNINNFTGGGGYTKIYARNNNFTGKFALSPRIIDFDSNNFSTIGDATTTAMTNCAYNVGTEMVRYGSNIWNCSKSSLTTLFGSGGTIAFTVGSGNFVDSNTIRFTPDEWKSVGANQVPLGRQVVPGQTGVTSAGKKLFVDRVYGETDSGGSQWVIVKGLSTATVALNDVYVFNLLTNFFVDGKQILTGPNAETTGKFPSTVNCRNIYDIENTVPIIVKPGNVLGRKDNSGVAENIIIGNGLVMSSNANEKYIVSGLGENQQLIKQNDLGSYRNASATTGAIKIPLPAGFSSLTSSGRITLKGHLRDDNINFDFTMTVVVTTVAIDSIKTTIVTSGLSVPPVFAKDLNIYIGNAATSWSNTEMIIESIAFSSSAALINSTILSNFVQCSLETAGAPTPFKTSAMSFVTPNPANALGTTNNPAAVTVSSTDANIINLANNYNKLLAKFNTLVTNITAVGLMKSS